MDRITSTPTSSFPNSSAPLRPPSQRPAATAHGLGDRPLGTVATIAGIMFVIFSAVVFLVGDRSANMDNGGRQQIPLPTAPAVLGGFAAD